MDVGFVTAFLGGALAILSPCGALLLPAFFASVAGTGPRLLLHGSVFTAGLLTVLVPLGIGAGALGSMFVAHRTLIIGVASAILIVLGILQMLGIGFDPSRALPGGRKLQQSAAARTGLVKTLLLGAASGVAGFCAGPILGAVLTLAAAKGELVLSGALLAVYGLGMVVPLLALAALWGRIGDRTRRALRGRIFTLFGREFHTTSVITGAVIAGAGVLFWITNGLVSLPELIPTSALAWLQGQSAALSGVWVDVAVVVALAAAALAGWFWWSRRRAAAADGAEPDPDPAPDSARDQARDRDRASS